MSIQGDNEPLHNRAFRALQNTLILISYWDYNLMCRYANAAHFEWFGIGPQDMINKMHIRDFLGTHFEKREEYLISALQGSEQAFEMLITLASGEIKKSRTIYIPEIVSGQVMGFYANIFDIGPLDHNHTKQIPKTLRLGNTNDELMNEIEQTLHNSLLNGFPGVLGLSKQYGISAFKLKTQF
ncbi:PAS domain-containing protein [Pedobacter frigidisoli]|uniref:PAS domain-containing protein n=1 Tax=Pedobacter frigidisoli TaxID=2530455 RepID=UPI0029317D95|nr:PAS domain-containing protein [Pedobacter frigidisoli]